MRAIKALCVLFLASAAHAVDPGVTIASVHSAGQEVCKTNYVYPVDKSLTGIYTGRCVAGVPDGAGVVLFRNGDRYEGNFAQGYMQGTGTWSYVSGDRYSGQWHKGQRQGEGVYAWARGSRYTGSFAGNVRQGQGTYVWPNGDRFVGEFRDNQHYNGTFHTARGGIFKCRAGRCG